jgi:hypothetical protein
MLLAVKGHDTFCVGRDRLGRETSNDTLFNILFRLPICIRGTVSTLAPIESERRRLDGDVVGTREHRSHLDRNTPQERIASRGAVSSQEKGARHQVLSQRTNTRVHQGRRSYPDILRSRKPHSLVPGDCIFFRPSLPTLEMSSIPSKGEGKRVNQPEEVPCLIISTPNSTLLPRRPKPQKSARMHRTRPSNQYP